MNSIINAVPITIGILGIAIGLIAYFKPRQRLKFAYQTKYTRYFAQEDYALPSEVVMTFEGEKVERLSKSTIIFWNAGTDVLRGEDIVESDPIRIGFEPTARILSHKVCGSTKDTNQINVHLVAEAVHELAVTYDYLDPRDGFVLEVMHNSRRRRPRVMGNAKGLSDGPKGLDGANPTQKFSRQLMLRASRFLPYVVSAVGGVFLLLGLASFLYLNSPNVFPAWVNSLVLWANDDFGHSDASALVALGAAYFIPFAAMIWFPRRRYPKALTIYVGREKDE